MGRLFKGQALQVHAVDARDGDSGQRDGAEHGEDLHHLVGAVGDRREIDVEGVVEQVALGFDRVEQTGDVVVDIADIGLMLGVDDGVGVALEMEAGVARIDEDAAQVDELALDGKDALQDLWRGIVEDGVFKRVDAVVEVVDSRKVKIDDGVEDKVEELAGMCIIAVAAGAVEGLLVVGQVGSAMVIRKSLPAKMSRGVKTGRDSEGSSGSGSRRTGLKTAKV